jgi:hypothetical protein
MAKKITGYLVTAAHVDTLRIQTFEYKTIKQAEEDAKRHGWVIQAVYPIRK